MCFIEYVGIVVWFGCGGVSIVSRSDAGTVSVNWVEEGQLVDMLNGFIRVGFMNWVVWLLCSLAYGFTLRG